MIHLLAAAGKARHGRAAGGWTLAPGSFARQEKLVLPSMLREKPMTEAEWLESADPYPMLVFLRGSVDAERAKQHEGRIHSGLGDLFTGPSDRVSERKLRLFSAAYIEHLRGITLDKLARQALDMFRLFTVDDGNCE